MTAFPGLVPTSVQTDLIKTILIARQGAPFANEALSFESMDLGMRKGAKITREPSKIDDNLKRSFVDRVGIKFEADLLQGNLATLLNCYLLSRAPVQARIETWEGDFYNLVNNPTGPGVGIATGSALMALGFEWTIGTGDRSLKLMGETEVSRGEWLWLVDELDTGHVGSTGSGSDLSLTEVGYDRAGHVRSGLSDCTVAGASVGQIGDGSKLTIKTVSRKSDLRKRPFYRFVEVSGEIIVMQTSKTDQLALADNLEAADGDIVLTTYEGETIELNSGCVLGVATTEIGDGKFETKIALQGEIPYNVDDATPVTIDIGVTAATTLTLDYALN